jgi:UDP-N-acetyl-2-amino-2-deoxyglucuronate dehydrogenase
MESMLTHESLDAVHICTPHYCHVSMAILALKKGLHVFMEKPPAISREQFKELIAADRESQGSVGISFQNRYNETTKKVTELLKEESFGKLLGGRAFVTWKRDSSYYKDSTWRGKRQTEGGGALINQSIHALDLLLGWLGKPVKVEATMRNHHLKGIVEVEDTMEAYLTFSKGANPVSASFYCTTAYVANSPVMIELIGENGFVRLEGDRVWYQTKNDKEPIGWQEPKKTAIGKAYWGNGHEACIRDFYTCLQSEKEYPNNLSSVENTFYTMMDMYASARKEEEKTWRK